MTRRRKKIETDEMCRRREEAMRPSPYLGYDHHQLGCYFLQREVLELAEMELRRGVWLNPFEKLFQIDLAICLLRQGKVREAREWSSKLADAWPKDRMVAQLVNRLAAANAPAHPPGKPIRTRKKI
jgi:hypothetical protein